VPLPRTGGARCGRPAGSQGARQAARAACDDLLGVAGWLEDGFTCRLPLLALEGVR